LGIATQAVDVLRSALFSPALYPLPLVPSPRHDGTLLPPCAKSVIDEVDAENWRIGGLQGEEFRQRCGESQNTGKTTAA